MIWMLLTACMLEEPLEETPANTAARIDADSWKGFVQTREIVSKPYHIDAIYASMRGPSGFDYANLLDTEKPELLWITGYRTMVVDAETQKGLSQEYMCHANLDFDAKTHYGHFPTSPPISATRPNVPNRTAIARAVAPM